MPNSTAVKYFETSCEETASKAQTRKRLNEEWNGGCHSTAPPRHLRWNRIEITVQTSRTRSKHTFFVYKSVC